MTARSPLALALALPLALVAGCDAPPATPRAKARPILGQKTQEIKDAPREIASGAAVKAPPRPIAKDPITVSGNAYVSAIGQTSIGQIKHAVDLHQAETGEYPKTYAEFMEKIIKANNIKLPTLPSYQEYGYDAPTHALILLEYPDKKANGG